MNKGIENILKKTPLPMAGLAFGLTGLGSLFSEFGQGAWAMPLFGVLGFAVLLIALGKIVFFPECRKRELSKPNSSGGRSSYPRCVDVRRRISVKINADYRLALWILAAIIMTIYSAWFIWKYLFHFQLKQVFAAFLFPLSDLRYW